MDCNIIDYNPYNICSNINNNNLYINLNLLHKYDRELTLCKIDDGIQDTLRCLHFLDKIKSSMEFENISFPLTNLNIFIKLFLTLTKTKVRLSTGYFLVISVD